MPGLIIGGNEYQIPGVDIVNFHDEPKYKIHAPEDMRMRRTRWIRSFFWHNTKNIQTTFKPGKGPDTHLEDRITKLWALDKRHAGAHLAVDWDGTVVCMADLLRDATYHASQVNEVSIGAELYEDSNGVVYELQLEQAVKVTEFCCAFFGIQRQIPEPLFNKVIPRLLEGGRACVGVFGHCHAYAGKPNDPSDHIFWALRNAGFQMFDFINGTDIVFWQRIQRHHGVTPADGIPGPVTCDALQASGYANGLWRFPEQG